MTLQRSTLCWQRQIKSWWDRTDSYGNFTSWLGRSITTLLWRNHSFFSKKNVTTIILILGATYFPNCDCVRETFSGLSSYGGSEILICLCLFCPFSYNIYQFHSLFYNHSWWLDEINVSWGTSNRYEESLVPWSDASQTFFLGKSIFGDLMSEMVDSLRDDN